MRFLNLKTMDATAVEGGRQAIEAVKKGDYAVAFIEIKMPDIDGLETLIELKKVAPKVKYVMMTGDYSDLRVRLAEKEGAVVCMKKPFDIGELSQVIAEFIR